jgi:hypothetical protein
LSFDGDTIGLLHFEQVTPVVAAGPGPLALTAAMVTKSWASSKSVRGRFVQDGHRFFFPNGDPAFRDLGRQLTTASENTWVVASLIQIAHARGWLPELGR